MRLFNASLLIGDITIPEKITKIEAGIFEGTVIKGTLNLNNVKEFVYNALIGGAFSDCSLSGELIIPFGVTDIPSGTFAGNNFIAVYFPSSLKTIGDGAFFNNRKLEIADIKEGLISIGTQAFSSEGGCQIKSLVLPSTLQTIGARAFLQCFYISSIVSHAIEPPTIQTNAFSGVPKDNFAVEVPSQSVMLYQSDDGWSDFKRITAFNDFSISRHEMRVLNAECNRTFTLKAPSNQTWSIDSLPEWITVNPMQGQGEMDVTVTVSEMERTQDTFEINTGTYNSPVYETYAGRMGVIIFKLDSKDYTCSLTVEQYDSDFYDGEIQRLNTATKGDGVNIFFLGDGYDAKDITDNFYIDNVSEGVTHFFDIEPFKTYKEYFNVYSILSLSPENGVGTVNTIVDNKFGSILDGTIRVTNVEQCFQLVKDTFDVDFSNSLIILLVNNSSSQGLSYVYSDGSAIACCPISTESYPYDFRGVIQHEAGGVAFGKLGEEGIIHHAFIDSCPLCSMYSTLMKMINQGWAKNLSISGNATQVPWAHFIYNPKYSDYVDIYEGGYVHSRGVFRSEANSCMNNNIPYFNAISRQAIVERIMECAGESFSLEEFYANDDNSFGTITKSGTNNGFNQSLAINPLHFRRVNGPIFLGDHPDVNN